MEEDKVNNPTNLFGERLKSGLSAQGQLAVRLNEMGFSTDGIHGNDKYLMTGTLNPDINKRNSGLYQALSDLLVCDLVVEVKSFSLPFRGPQSWPEATNLSTWFRPDGGEIMNAALAEDGVTHYDLRTGVTVTHRGWIPVETVSGWRKKNPRPDFYILVPKETVSQEDTWIVIPITRPVVDLMRERTLSFGSQMDVWKIVPKSECLTWADGREHLIRHPRFKRKIIQATP